MYNVQETSTTYGCQVAPDVRSRLTRDTVVAQAVVLGDREGLDAVTFRRLADQLGVTPMALYWHVKNKDELLIAMADQLLAEVVPERDPDAPWNQQLRSMVTALLRAMRAHPCAAGLMSTAHKVQADSFTRATETALELLSDAGFTLVEGFQIASHLLGVVIGLVERAPDCAPEATETCVVERQRQKRLTMQALPIDSYPRLVEFAATPPQDPETYYAFGVDLLLAGVEELARRRG